MRHSDAILNEHQLGVIIPPPEIKKIIDKAAELVGRYGSSIEATFQNEEKNLPKFSFLKEGDPYRPYYLQRANEIAKNFVNKSSSGNVCEIKDSKNEKLLGRKSQIEELKDIDGQEKIKNHTQIQDELRKFIEEKKTNKFLTNEIKAPVKDLFSISHPNISSLDMDILKITAQFVARNGQKFLSGLSEREIRNPQFDFLKPQHNLFGYFTYLVESYAKCLRKEDGNKAGLYFDDRDAILKRATERYLWEKKQKELSKKKDTIDENERNQMSQIDWFDFAIVEVIEFTEEELYNTVPIMNEFDTVLNKNINSIEANVNTMLKLTTVNEVFEEEKIPEPIKIFSSVIEPPSLAEDLPEPGMKIVKNYKRKIAENVGAKKDVVKCPLCKESISIDDWAAHIRVELLDPKWREIQKELTERKMELSLAPTSDFLSYLNDFSRYRPDLFGDVKDVVKIEAKKKVEARAPSTVWDGIAPNISRTTANIAMLFQQNRKNIEENLKKESAGSKNANTGSDQDFDESGRLISIQSSVGSGPSSFAPNSIQLSVSQQNAKLNSTVQQSLDKKNMLLSNPNFKQNSGSKILPEEVFLLKNNKPFKLNIKLPLRNEINKNFNGQIITITVDPKDMISSLKNKINTNLSVNTSTEEYILRTLNDQELEDNHTFAYYNLTNNSFIELDM